MQSMKAGAEKDGGVACIASGGGIAAADGLAYANGSGGRDAERNHVGERDGVESDLMAGERDGAEAGDERRDEGEDGDFGGHLQRGGKTKSEEATDALEIGISGSFEEIGAMAVVVPEKIGDEEKAEISSRECGGQTGAGDAEGRESKFAVDEDVVAKKIDEIGGDQSEGDGTNHVHALEGAAYGEVEESGRRPTARVRM